jgi:hypothetical protein
METLLFLQADGLIFWLSAAAVQVVQELVVVGWGMAEAAVEESFKQQFIFHLQLMQLPLALEEREILQQVILAD